jgi:hypothetical protein
MSQQFAGERMHGRSKSAVGGHSPGHAYKRNFNASPRGKMKVRMHRNTKSRSHSARG